MKHSHAAAAILVPASVPQKFANLHFGDRYGIDWQYEEYKPCEEISRDVLLAIENEKRLLAPRLGGVDHDDTESLPDGIDSIVKECIKARLFSADDTTSMVRIAALTINALESRARARAPSVEKAQKWVQDGKQATVMPAQRPPRTEQATNGVDSEAMHAKISASSREEILGADGVITAGLAGEAPEVSDEVHQAANAFVVRVLEYAVKISDGALSVLPPGAFLHVTLGKKA